MFTLQKLTELGVVQLGLPIISSSKALLNGAKLLGEYEANLLNHGEFPVKSASVLEASAKGFSHVAADT